VARYTFGDDKLPTARDELTVRLPKDRPLRYAAINGDVPVAETEEAGEKASYIGVASASFSDSGLSPTIIMAVRSAEYWSYRVCTGLLTAHGEITNAGMRCAST